MGQAETWELGNLNTYQMGAPLDIVECMPKERDSGNVKTLSNHNLSRKKSLRTSKEHLCLMDAESWFQETIFAREMLRARKPQKYIISGAHVISGAAVRVYDRLFPFELADVKHEMKLKLNKNSALPPIPHK